MQHLCALDIFLVIGEYVSNKKKAQADVFYESENVPEWPA